jgi:hypothetical protein
MQTDEEIIEKAINLTDSYYLKVHNETSNVNWVTKNSNDQEGDYCDKCIEKAVKNHRKEYLIEQRKKPIRPKNTEIPEYMYDYYRDDPFDKFDYCYNYGGGYENDGFLFCDECGQRLEISLLLDEQELDHWENVEIGKTDSTGYELNMIFECYDNTNYKELKIKIVELAKRAIEVFKE